MVNIITDHIDIWTSAQTQKTNGVGRGNHSANNQRLHGIKKLRELILELAVRGKLVPQDPNEESASILLEKIVQEKARLIKEGKLRKQEPLPEIADDEKLFDLPNGWVWSRLGDIGIIFNGNSINEKIKEEKYTSIKGGLPFIATKDVGYGWDALDYNNGILIPEDEPRFKVAHKGAVLICAEGGSAGKKCGITNQDICFGNKLFAIELYVNIKSSYILANYLCPSFYSHFTQKMTGIIGGVSTTKFSQLLVPIPPATEQHRIVAKVDELMAICDQLEQQQADRNNAHQTIVETLLVSLNSVANQDEFVEAWHGIANHFDILFTTEHSVDKLKQTILQLAVMGKLVPQDPNDEPASVLLKKIAAEKARLVMEGKISKQRQLPEIRDDEIPYKLPVGWKWVWFPDVYFFQEGPGIRNWQFRTEGIKLLNVQNIVNGKLVLDNTDKYIDPVEYEQKYLHFTIKENDLLFASSGGSWGKTAFFSDPCCKVIVNTSTVRMHPYINECSRIYMRNYVDSQIFKNQMVVQLVGMQPNFGSTHLSKVIIPLPPSAEQIRISSKVSELMALCDTLKARINDTQKTQIQLADAIVEKAVA